MLQAVLKCATTSKSSPERSSQPCESGSEHIPTCMTLHVFLLSASQMHKVPLPLTALDGKAAPNAEGALPCLSQGKHWTGAMGPARTGKGEQGTGK